MSQTLKHGTNLDGVSEKDADRRAQKVIRSICIHVKKSEIEKNSNCNPMIILIFGCQKMKNVLL